MTYLRVSIPFGDAEATIDGDYFPGRAGCMYKPNGDPGDPPEYPEFFVAGMTINGNDVYDEVARMYVKKPNGEYETWLESVFDKILEEAYDAYCAIKYSS